MKKIFSVYQTSYEYFSVISYISQRLETRTSGVGRKTEMTRTSLPNGLALDREICCALSSPRHASVAWVSLTDWLMLFSTTACLGVFEELR